MRRVLLLTDQSSFSKESAIEGLFKKQLVGYFDIDIVYFDRNVNSGSVHGNEVIVPWKCRRYGLVGELSKYIDISRYDFTVVRNFFPVLKQLLKVKNLKKIGFWESFPHTFRRYEEACINKIRKLIEYKVKNWQENRLLSKCDFYWPITDEHKKLFRPGLTIPTLAVPMGVDPAIFPEVVPVEKKSGPLRFVYIGTIDSLRQSEMVHRAFMASDADFILEYYSNSRNAAVDFIKKNSDPRVRFFEGLPREELFIRVSHADFGVCFLPEIKTYMASSPTKAMEYMALGLKYFGNDVGQYPKIIRENISYVKFSHDDIVYSVKGLVKCGRDSSCESIVFSYGFHAEEICKFLEMI